MSKEMEESEKRYRTLIEWSPEAILVHRKGTILYANPAAVSLFAAVDAATLLTHKTADLIHPDFLESQTARMNSILNRELIPQATDSKFRRFDGKDIDVQVQGTVIDYDGEPAIHVSIRDITMRKTMEREIRHLAFYDSLTNLPNRRLLDDRLKQTLSINKRSGSWGALLFLDLDNFKPLNDTYGHTVGDALLAIVANRLKKCVREIDTVARFGGDEFVLLLSEIGTSEAAGRTLAMTIAKKVSAALLEPYVLETHNGTSPPTWVTHRCTVSIGVVVFSNLHGTQDDLLKWADTAMYQAKGNGRNSIHLSMPPYTPCLP